MSKPTSKSPTSDRDLQVLIAQIHRNVETKDYGAALALCQHLINSQNTKRVGYRERAEVWQSLREDELAIFDLQNVVALDTPEPVDYYNLGIAFLKQTEAREAVKAFTRAIEIGTKTKFHYYTQSCRFHRAVAFLRLGMRDEALEDCKEIEDGYSCYIASQGLVTKAELVRQAALQ